MSAAKSIRERLGLSQDELAGYLNLSKAYISMVESGRRSLPTAAVVKIGKLEQLLAGTLPAHKSAKAITNVQKGKATEHLDLYILGHQSKAHQAAKALKAVQQEHGQAGKLLQVLRLLQKERGGTPKERAWLTMMEAVAEEKLERHGMHAQVQLQLLVAQFQQQVTAAKALLKEIKNKKN